MPFIGNQPAESYSAFQKQDFSTSATTSYTLDHPVANGNEIALFINFVRQEPTAAYTASGTSLTLTSATTSSDDMYCVYLGKAVQTVNPPSGSVGSSQVAASIITGQTAETSIATDDTVLIHDTSAGALRKMTRANFVSGVGGTNTPHFEAYRSGSQAVSDNTWTTVVFNAEARDASSVYDTSNGRFTPTTAGKYFCYAIVIGGNDGASSLNYVLAKFFKNGSDYQTTSVNKLDFRSNPGANGQVATFSVIEFNGSSDYLEVKTQISTGSNPDVVESSVFGAYKIIE